MPTAAEYRLLCDAAQKLCNFIYDNPAKAVEAATQELDTISDDYASMYGIARGYYTKHPEKIADFKRELKSLFTYKTFTARPVELFDRLFNFLELSKNWSQGKFVPYFGWWEYPSINNRLINHLLFNAGICEDCAPILSTEHVTFISLLHTALEERINIERLTMERLLTTHHDDELSHDGATNVDDEEVESAALRAQIQDVAKPRREPVVFLWTDGTDARTPTPHSEYEDAVESTPETAVPQSAERNNGARSPAL